jgi:hypothetical protein
VRAGNILMTLQTTLWLARMQAERLKGAHHHTRTDQEPQG